MTIQSQTAPSAPAVFNFKESIQLRVVIIDNEPWFVAADVCAALSIGNTSMALERLDDDEKGISSIDTLGGKQESNIINESGLYSLILGSRKPEAKPFKKWVTSEVLPTIRKTGKYEMPSPEQPKLTTATKAQREPLVTAVRRLVKVAESKGRALSYDQAHSIVNLKMGVDNIESLTPEQIPQAMVLVGELLEKIVLEGDYLAKGEPDPKPDVKTGLAKEYITGNDENNIKKVIWAMCDRKHYKRSWSNAAWVALRARTQAPSPERFEVQHLPLVADELHRLLNACSKFDDYLSRFEKDVLKTVFRCGGDIDALLAEEDKQRAERQQAITDTFAVHLDGWQNRQLAAVTSREICHGDYSID